MKLPKRIQPKLHSMPRKHTPSAIYMQMHQLANEKERLQQEVTMLQDRQRQVLQRLAEIERDLTGLETEHEQYRLPAVQNPETQKNISKTQSPSESKTSFRWMTIDY